jgi:uncharacterized protein (TIGR02246 family)
MPRYAMNGLNVLVAAVAFAGLVGAAQWTAASERAPDAVCAAAETADIAALLDRWNATVLTAHPDKMTRLYAHDGGLVPPNGGPPRFGYSAIRDYFVYALQGQPRIEVNSRGIRVGCNSAVDTGIYTVSVLSKAAPGTRETEQMRYSIVYGWRSGGWLIEHHHASRLIDAEDVAKALKPQRAPEVAGFVRRVADAPKALSAATRTPKLPARAASSPVTTEARPARADGTGDNDRP